MDNSIETLSSQQEQPLPLPSIEVNQEYDKEDITLHCNEYSSLHSSPTQSQPSSQLQHQNIIQDEEQVLDSELMTELVSISSTLSKTSRQQSLHQVDWPEVVSGDVNIKDGKDPLYGHEHQSNIDDAKVYGDKFPRNSIPKTPFQLNDHSRTLTGKSISFKCPWETCEKTYAYETNLKNHYFNCHTNQLSKCPLKNCPNVYTKKAKMRRHFITHESQQCVKSAFQSLSALPIRAHTDYHSQRCMYKCTRNHCYETFDRISQLREHLQTHIESQVECT